MQPDVIKTAIEKAGSVKALADLLGIKPQAISQWKRVPIEHARAIETLTEVSKHLFRPDVWDAPDSVPRPIPAPLPAPAEEAA